MTLAAYHDLIARKRVRFTPRGFDEVSDLSAAMFPHQRAVTNFLLGAGCGAAFLDTGLGKSFIALEWGRVVAERSGKPVLMLAPLAVGPQHQREAQRFGVDALYLRDPTALRAAGRIARPAIVITNYERMHLWDAREFAGVILDESSILKSFAGKTKQALIDTFAATPYRLACTATPAPNDHMELGQHAEFLGIMRSREMLSRWFINDTSTASQSWRLKGHAVQHFWDWVASWARCVAKPSDLGFSDEGFALPDLVTRQHVIGVDATLDAGADKFGQALMFRVPEASATQIHKEKRRTLEARADKVAEVVASEPGEPWVVWVETDAEADAITARISEAVEVRGSMKPETKESRLVAFGEGRVPVLVTKPSIAGFGLNWQHCARTAFVGLSYSYEAYYQAIRRFWRFGQQRPVHVHVAMAETERAVAEAIARKAADHETMKREMVASMGRAIRPERAEPYDARSSITIPEWLQ